ncbi:MAG: hypothetical protein WD037_14080 [Balneolales bacterium]
MFILLIILVISVSGVNTVTVDDPLIGQVSRPFAEVTDPELIDLFLNEFLIPESDVTKMEIIDVTANGFGPDDIIVTHPSMRAYIVEEASDAALDVMRNWSLEDYRVDSENVDPDVFDPEISGRVEDAAKSAIIADLLRTLDRNYASIPIRMRLERDENGFTFAMWDFDENAMQHTPYPPIAPDSVFVYQTETDSITLSNLLNIPNLDLPNLDPDTDSVTLNQLDLPALSDNLSPQSDGTITTPYRLPDLFSGTKSIAEYVDDQSTPDSVYIYRTENDTIIIRDTPLDYPTATDHQPVTIDLEDLAMQPATPEKVFVYQTERDTIVLDRMSLNLPLDVGKPVAGSNGFIDFPTRDTVEQNIYDVIYISKTVSDTVFVPAADK